MGRAVAAPAGGGGECRDAAPPPGPAGRTRSPKLTGGDTHCQLCPSDPGSNIAAYGESLQRVAAGSVFDPQPILAAQPEPNGLADSYSRAITDAQPHSITDAQPHAFFGADSDSNANPNANPNPNPGSAPDLGAASVR